MLVRLRFSTKNPGEVTGYAVGLPHHTNDDGGVVWYGGGKLAVDLTLPRLCHRWAPRWAVLTGQEVADFDREYRQTMADAAESLDLSGVVSMLRRWQRVAWSTRDGQDARRHMLASADRLSAGGDVATESWQQTKARLGL